jgi:hypothetical protein
LQTLAALPWLAAVRAATPSPRVPAAFQSASAWISWGPRFIAST